jgi:hypothetical protein
MFQKLHQNLVQLLLLACSGHMFFFNKQAWVLLSQHRVDVGGLGFNPKRDGGGWRNV